MNDLIKWAVKTTATAIFWVFVLSINLDGRTLFSHANEMLVQNSVVRLADEELRVVFDRLYTTARKTFSEQAKEEKEVF